MVEEQARTEAAGAPTLLDTLVDEAPLGIAVLDADLRFVRVNRCLAEIDGLTVTAHVGRPLREIVPGLADVVEPVLRRVLATGTPVLDLDVEGEAPAAPGVRRRWAKSVYPVPGVAGRPVALAVIVQDVTERHRVEQLLRRSEARYRSLVDASADLTAMLASDGRISYLNRAGRNALGLPPAGDLALRLTDLLSTPSARLLREQGLPSAAAGDAWRAEVELRRVDDGRVVSVDLTVFPVPGEHPATLAAVAHDVTERRREEAAREGLLQLTTALSPARSVQEVAATVTTALPGYVGSYSANLALYDQDRVTLRFLHIDRGFAEDAVREWRVFDARDEAPVAEAARTGRAVFNGTVADFVAGRPHLAKAAAASGVNAWASLPLIAGGRTLGVLGLTWLDEQDFAAAQRTYLLTVADACAQAVERARLQERDHDTAIALQHALLPQRLPQVPGVALAARYSAGTEGVDVGGDWYDVWHTAQGRIAVALGDVMGRGAAAAAVMGQVRAATRAFVAQSDAPVHVASSLDRLFADFEVADAIVTLVYAVIDPQAHTVELVNLGHLPPLLLHDGRSTTLPVEPGLPLGVLPAPERSATTLTLPPGATLLLFTDGLVESRERPVGEGLVLVTRVVADLAGAEPAPDLGGLCDGMLRAMLGGTAHDDDVALLAVRLDVHERAARARRPGERRVAVSMAPEPASASRARQLVHETLRRWSLSRVEDDAALAVTELVTNAVLHGRTQLDLVLLVVGDRLRIEVTDRFGGLPVPLGPAVDAHGGRGLVIVRQIAQAWGVDRTDVGKRVWAELLL